MNFRTIWNLHPTNLKELTGDREMNKPCTSFFKNQCAIRVSQALQNAGFPMGDYPYMTCARARPNDPEVKDHSNKVIHALSAEDLAKWMAKTARFGTVKKYSGADKQLNIKGKTGILFIKDYWQRNTDTGNAMTGDHIDLWDGNRLTGQLPDAGINFEANLAKELWFWEIR